VSLAGDHQATHAADALAAVAVEGDGLLTGRVELLVEHVEHLEEAHVGADVGDLVDDELAGVAGAGLAPDLQGEIHDRGPREVSK
jgi:hypothetical protein